MKVLLIATDADLATMLTKALEPEGHEVHTAPTEDTARAQMRIHNYEIILLDFERENGLKLLDKLRSEDITTPVIVLSTRHGASDRIQAQNLGADDYITKPFSLRELLVTIEAISRRGATHQEAVCSISLRAQGLCCIHPGSSSGWEG